MKNIELLKQELKQRIDDSKNSCILTDPETIRIALELEHLLQDN